MSLPAVTKPITRYSAKSILLINQIENSNLESKMNQGLIALCSCNNQAILQLQLK
jgi:hypothetical protein